MRRLGVIQRENLKTQNDDYGMDHFRLGPDSTIPFPPPQKKKQRFFLPDISRLLDLRENAIKKIFIMFCLLCAKDFRMMTSVWQGPTVFQEEIRPGYKKNLHNVLMCAKDFRMMTSVWQGSPFFRRCGPGIQKTFTMFCCVRRILG